MRYAAAFFMLLASTLFAVWFCLCLALLWYFLMMPASLRPRYFLKCGQLRNRQSRKPDWVRKELIRLQAHLPDFGCRKLTDLFNSLYAIKGMTVGKSFVARLLREHAYDVQQLRRKWKTRIPAPLPYNHTWGLDATGKMDLQGHVHPILGIVDHGSRLAVCLLPLRDLSTITILRALLDAIERFGKPRYLRCDNAAQFHSLLFRASLNVLGIKQQFSKPGMPWMNGRIERLFGTLKERLNRLAVADLVALEFALAEFRVWYNHLRPHQHLMGRTPGEAWNGIDPFKQAPKEVRYAVGWNGLLAGYYVRR